MCTKVVTGQSLNFRGSITEEKIEKQGIFHHLQYCYTAYFDDKFVDIQGLSISQILDAACKRLETCTLNNIEIHFVKHLNRFLHAYLGDDKELVRNVRNRFLYGMEGPETTFANPLPSRNTSFDNDLKERPWVYLQCMITMSRTVEGLGKKTLSPIPIRRSYIPKCIDLDTNALVQLLFDKKEEIEIFATWYFVEYGTKPSLKSKSDLGNSFKKVFGREPKDDTEDFFYQQSFWKYLCNIDALPYNYFKFSNSITTDGVSINFSLLSEDDLKKKSFKNRQRKRKTKEDEFEPMSKLQENTLYLGCDPGKGDLVTITDGILKFRYTKGERRSDMKTNFFQEKNLRKRRKVVLKGEYQTKDRIIPGYFPIVNDPTLAFYEEAVLSRNSSKSSNLEIFVKWIKDKCFLEDQDVYNELSLRNDRFTMYTLKQSSEDKMIRRLKTFVESRKKGIREPKEYSPLIMKENVKKDKFEDVVIFYGNWGRSPNMKNNEPTPGIGLRRKIHNGCYKTVTVDETYTSKTCPCCRERTLHKPKLEGPTRQVSEKHHLLRCQNVDCTSRWWNRNVVGSYNILLKGLWEGQASSREKQITTSPTL